MHSDISLGDDCNRSEVKVFSQWEWVHEVLGHN
ncbi:hypothetical protein TNCT_692141, partial [Trichonephila clavata]